MRKILSALLIIVILCSTISICANAGKFELPFVVSAPTDVSVEWLNRGDSPTTMQLTYSLKSDITEFFAKKNEAIYNGTLSALLKAYDYNNVEIAVQIDWALDDIYDSVSGWHYNDFWDGNKNGLLGVDNDYVKRCSVWDNVDVVPGDCAQTTNSVWILRNPGDGWNDNGKTPGV